MSSIRPASTGTFEERLARVEDALRREEEAICATVIDEPFNEEFAPTLTSASTVILGGMAIPWDRKQFRTLLPDERWAVWAAGWLANPDGTVTLGIYAQRDDTVPVLLGQQVFPLSAPFRKVLIGPYPARGPLAPEYKTTPSFQADAIQHFNVLGNVQTTGHTASLRRWTLWVRMSATPT